MDGTEAGQHVHLDINAEWLEAVKSRADMSLRRKPPSEPTIFRVPPSMRCANLPDYEPKLVSIGPYHRGKSMNLKAMEELKWRLLHNFLSKVPNGSRNEGLRKMKELELRARNCYSEVIDLDSDQFVEMLLLDGCFLVQIFTEPNEELKSLLRENMWFWGLIFRDLFLLENQLPYFIIEHLLDTLIPGQDRTRLPKDVIDWFALFLPENFNPKRKRPDPRLEVDHLLHMFHKWIVDTRNTRSARELEEVKNTRSYSCFVHHYIKNRYSIINNFFSKMLPRRTSSSLSEELPPPVPTMNEPANQKLPPSIPTMTRLVEAGVKICKVREAESFLDISFRKDKGVLEIPAICVDDHASFLFANLVAWEQSSRKHGLDVTNYTMFLNDIINTPIDVELLHEKGIIDRDLGSNEDIASLFNKLGNGVVYDPEKYLGDVRKGLNDYCQSRWPRWRAKAVHDYFNTPWAIISLGAAVLLLGLTILQSVYAVLDYYKK